MASFTLTNNDTIKINGRLFTKFAGDNTGSISFPNPLATVKHGKSGNSVYALNENGRQCDVVLNLVRGSSDDCFLNTQLTLMKADFPSFTLLTGEIVKRVGDGNTMVRDDTYILSGGVFAKEVEAKEGDSTAVWRLCFVSAPRAIG